MLYFDNLPVFENPKEQMLCECSKGKYDERLMEALKKAYLQAYKLGPNWCGWIVNLYFHIDDETIEVSEPISYGTYSLQKTPGGYEIRPDFWHVEACESPKAWIELCSDEQAYEIVSRETDLSIEELEKLMNALDVSLLDLFKLEFPEAYEAYYEEEDEANAQCEAETNFSLAKEGLLYYIEDYFKINEEYINKEEK